MKSQHLSDDFCLDYLTAELPAEERVSLDSHLEDCSACRLRVEQYQEILRQGLPSIADEAVEGLPTPDLAWSIDEGENRLYAAICQDAAPPQEHAIRNTDSLGLETFKGWFGGTRLRPNLRVAFLLAASMFLAFGLGTSIYRLGLKRGLQQSQKREQSVDYGSLKAQIDALVRTRDAIQTNLTQRETLMSVLKAQLREQQKQNDTLEASLLSARQEAQDQAQRISAQRDDLARKLEDQQAAFTTAQARVDVLQQEGRNEALRVVSLENQIQQMSQLAKNREGTIDEQQRMLAADRDIRDLMGARDLYIAEVYDVGGNGKKKKPYGRVFYTKGKSLIFYGYDLDQQPGLKNANAFQAWGLRGPDRNTAINLGVMYVDNSTNKRWVLRFDDSKALEEINAVFVTVEPNGGSRVPRGQQVLFAYLKEEPNHP